MNINFPTSLDTLVNPTATDNTVTVPHATQHANANDAIEALEAKVGINLSTDTASIDYKLKNASSVNPGHKHTLAGAITDITLTNPVNGNGLFFNGTYWYNADVNVPDASTTVKGVVKMSTSPAIATIAIAVGDNDTRVPTQGENDALAGTSGTPSSSNKYVTNLDTGTSVVAGSIVRRKATTGGVAVPTTPTDTEDASSKSYVDGKSMGCTASDTLVFSADTSSSTTSTDYIEVKRININRTGTIRVKFDIKSSNSTTAYGKIYIDGYPIGSEKSSTNNSSFETQTETSLTISKPSYISLYVKTSSNTVYYQNLRIYYDNSTTESNGGVVKN